MNKWLTQPARCLKCILWVPWFVALVLMEFGTFLAEGFLDCYEENLWPWEVMPTNWNEEE